MAFWAYGTVIKKQNTTTGVYETVASVKSIGGPSLEADTVDVTNFDSVGGFEEIIPTLLRAGEVSLECNYLPQDATQTYGAGGMIDIWENRTLTNFAIVYSDDDTTEWQFSGYVTKVETNASVAEALTLNLTIKVTGSPIFSMSTLEDLTLTPPFLLGAFASSSLMATLPALALTAEGTDPADYTLTADGLTPVSQTGHIYIKEADLVGENFANALFFCMDVKMGFASTASVTKDFFNISPFVVDGAGRTAFTGDDALSCYFDGVTKNIFLHNRNTGESCYVDPLAFALGQQVRIVGKWSPANGLQLFLKANTGVTQKASNTTAAAKGIWGTAGTQCIEIGGRLQMDVSASYQSSSAFKNIIVANGDITESEINDYLNSPTTFVAAVIVGV